METPRPLASRPWTARRRREVAREQAELALMAREEELSTELRALNDALLKADFHKRMAWVVAQHGCQCIVRSAFAKIDEKRTEFVSRRRMLYEDRLSRRAGREHAKALRDASVAAMAPAQMVPYLNARAGRESVWAAVPEGGTEPKLRSKAWLCFKCYKVNRLLEMECEQCEEKRDMRLCERLDGAARDDDAPKPKPLIALSAAEVAHASTTGAKPSTPTAEATDDESVLKLRRSALKAPFNVAKLQTAAAAGDVGLVVAGLEACVANKYVAATATTLLGALATTGGLAERVAGAGGLNAVVDAALLHGDSIELQRAALSTCHKILAAPTVEAKRVLSVPATSRQLAAACRAAMDTHATDVLVAWHGGIVLARLVACGGHSVVAAAEVDGRRLLRAADSFISSKRRVRASARSHERAFNAAIDEIDAYEAEQQRLRDLAAAREALEAKRKSAEEAKRAEEERLERHSLRNMLETRRLFAKNDAAASRALAEETRDLFAELGDGGFSSALIDEELGTSADVVGEGYDVCMEVAAAMQERLALSRKAMHKQYGYDEAAEKLKEEQLAEEAAAYAERKAAYEQKRRTTRVMRGAVKAVGGGGEAAPIK